MTLLGRVFLIVLTSQVGQVLADEFSDSSSLDILVTFENSGTSATGSDFGAPYRNRKRYSVAAEARQSANAIAKEYLLTEVDHWPIKSLSVYCIVYRVQDDEDPLKVIERLNLDPRVESAQALQMFETMVDDTPYYNDEYAALQHGLQTLNLSSAHRYTLGDGIRIGVIDSHVDIAHEDLAGRIASVSEFADKSRQVDMNHGTAVTSIIGAMPNNKVGIVGVAPDSSIDLFVSCWSVDNSGSAVCNSFTLAKAMDELLESPPDILNLSLVGPRDDLLERLLTNILGRGVVVVAAEPANNAGTKSFPASMDGVIGVQSSATLARRSPEDGQRQIRGSVYAPGDQIMVAVPGNEYDFQSGSSLAAAHVSGVIALLLATAPEQTSASVEALLLESQRDSATPQASINACVVLYLADSATHCPEVRNTGMSAELKPNAEDYSGPGTIGTAHERH